MGGMPVAGAVRAENRGSEGVRDFVAVLEIPGHIFRREDGAQHDPLAEMAAGFLQKSQLIFRFHTLGDRFQFEVLSQGNHSLNNGTVGFHMMVMDKSLIDFQTMNGHVL